MVCNVGQLPINAPQYFQLQLLHKTHQLRRASLVGTGTA
jgi:hypothetical protein